MIDGDGYAYYAERQYCCPKDNEKLIWFWDDNQERVRQNVLFDLKSVCNLISSSLTGFTTKIWTNFPKFD